VRTADSRIQTRYGEFRMIAYESQVNGGESHIALVRGDLCVDCPAFNEGPAGGPLNNVLDGAAQVMIPGCPLCADPAPSLNGAGQRPPCKQAVLVRVHTRCTAGDVFAADCKCRETLDQSMRMIAEAGCGVVLYLHNTSRGFEIDRTTAHKSAFEANGVALQPATQESDCARIVPHNEVRARDGLQTSTGHLPRAIGLGSQILADLGIQRIRLLTNFPARIPALVGFGLEIVEQVAIPIEEYCRVG
jgi:3,4-dihydroxy 2-butanone 4-phosphate synthase/GTP cyclohydrolase II